MAVDIGPKIGIDGEAQFKRELNEISTGLKALGSEMAAVTAEFGANDKSMKAARESAKLLKEQQDQLNKQLEMQKTGLQSAIDKYGEKTIYHLTKKQGEMYKFLTTAIQVQLYTQLGEKD